MGRFFLIGVACVVLIWIALTDAQQKKIPNRLLGLLFFCALFFEAVFPGVAWGNRITGGILVSGILLIVIWIRPGAFGAGDVKLMAISGMMLGVGRNLTAFVFAIILAACYCLVRMLHGKREEKSEIAFGPFLCTGIVLSIFFGESFIRWYLS